MSNREPADAIVTPEAVYLNVDVAGLGSRMIASFIDTLIQGALVLVFFLVFVRSGSVAGVGGTAGVVIFALALFLILWGYYPLFEGFGRGRTPGKRVQRLRVMQADGQPAGFGAIVVRNLLRIADFLPAYYAVGAITILATRRSQRIGDLAAGTIVVRDRAAPAPSLTVRPPAGMVASALDTTGLTERDYDVARAFLQRRESLEPRARAGLAHKIADALRARGAEASFAEDEQFIEAIVHAYRNRFSPTDADGRGAEPPPYEQR